MYFLPLPLVLIWSAVVLRYLGFTMLLQYSGGEQNLGCVAPSSGKFEKLNSNMSFPLQGSLELLLTKKKKKSSYENGFRGQYLKTLSAWNDKRKICFTCRLAEMSRIMGPLPSDLISGGSYKHSVSGRTSCCGWLCFLSPLVLLR